jgi:class 3 adenylate cyclase
VVTVLFCDVVGSTALGESTDPEALGAMLGRYLGRMKAIVERHGGTVEKFIGDAVMAVFGFPVAHEDDALRSTLNWRQGDKIPLTAERTLRVLGVRDDDADQPLALVVEDLPGSATRRALAAGDSVEVGRRGSTAGP